MTWRTDEGQRKWLPLGLAFLLGLFIGWWIIGWWLWPVSWHNSLPQDLRAEEKAQYLLMVAESYARTGDLQTAKQRTETWSPDQLATDMQQLQTGLSQRNPGQAAEVQQLAAALQVLPRAAQAGGGVIATQPPPVTTPAPSSSIFARICPGLLGLLVAVAGIAALFWLWRQWQRRSSGPAPYRPVPVGDEAWAPAATGTEEQEAEQWHEVGGEVEPSEARTETPDEAPWEAAPVARGSAPDAQGFVTGPSARPAAAAAATAGAASPAPGPSAAVAGAPSGQVTKIGEFMASYHAGEPDYDEAFDIKDASGAVVGQCGLSLMMPVGRGSDQAAALQVWLWEERDQYTQVKVLMSDSAYRDTVLRDQLAEENPAVPIRQGSEFDLESHRLALQGTVEKLVYEEGETNRIFNTLAVRLRVFQKA